MARANVTRQEFDGEDETDGSNAITTRESKTASKADKNLPERLAFILNLLHQGLEIDKHSIAQRFDTTVRTIERDLADRLGKLIEKASDGRWQLRVESRAVVPIGYLNHYAKLTDTEYLLPDNSLASLLPNLQALQESSLRVLGESYEDLRSKSRDFAALDGAIQANQVCHFSYKDKIRSVKPYRLLNSKGLWYLAAVEGKTLKAFAFARISQLRVDQAEVFKPQADIAKRVADEADIWFTEQKIEVLLRISPRVAHYFESRELLPEQRVREKAADGSLLLECQAAHPTQILAIVRSWIPNVRIVSPQELRIELNAVLSDYLRTDRG